MVLSKDVFVHAGWTEGQEVIGICHFDSLKGEETVLFEYDAGWMKNHPGFFMDRDLSLVSGIQYPARGKSSFCFLLDCAPERWGRMLLDRQDVRDRLRSGKTPRRLTFSDYLLGVSDAGRHGAIRFSDGKGTFYASGSEPIPAIADIRELEDAARTVEYASPKRDDALSRILDCGSSLGGSRPKANVLDTDGSMWIAKFPSRFDAIDSGAWEMVCNRLMALCGLRAPEARLIRLSDHGCTFLTKRFDRVLTPTGDLKRIHMSSAMTLLGYTDDVSGASYADIGELCESLSSSPESDMKELWRRLVFNVCVTNTDDHLRNHSFLYNGKGWELAPAYDVVPNPGYTIYSLSAGGESHENCIENALSVSEFFRLSRDEAVSEALKIQRIVSGHWFETAQRYGIRSNEAEYLSGCFSEAELDIRDLF